MKRNEPNRSGSVKAGASPKSEPALEIKLNRPQSQAHQLIEPNTTIVLPWGRGVGKSWFQRFLWYSTIFSWDGVARPDALNGQRGVRIVHLMPRFRQAKAVHGKPTEFELGASGPWSFLGGRINRTEWIISFPGGSTIQWFGTTEANSNRGLRADIVTLDEVDDIDPEDFDAVVRPWLSEPWSLRIVILCGTPRRGRYGLLYREHRAALEGRLRYASIFATYKDAPETVDQAYAEEQVDNLARIGQLAVARREWFCDFDAADGNVYGMFEESFHVRRRPRNIRWTEILIGCDWGWENPGVMLVIGVIGKGKDAVCWILEEVYERYRLPSWWGAKAKEIAARYRYLAPMRWYGDPSRADLVNEIKAMADVRFFDTINAVEPGIAAVAEKLSPLLDPTDPEGKRRIAHLYVSEDCANTIFEFKNYKRKRDPRDPDRFLDDVEKKNDHAMDAARYAMVSYFGVPEIVRSMGQRPIGLM
jgi:hypothetical protein